MAPTTDDSARVLIGFAEFCKANNFSRAWLYRLLADGRGPRTVVVGRRRFVTVEAAREWARDLEAKAPTKILSRPPT